MRTFIATCTLPASRELEKVMQVLRTLPNVKVVDPGQLHLTLRFLGETDSRLVPRIGDAIAEVAAHNAPFTLTCRGLGCFPNLRSPRVVWAGVEPDDALSALAADIEAVCAGMGFRKDRHPFNPHVTLARVKVSRDRRMQPESAEAIRRLLDEHAAAHFCSQHVTAVTLYHSEQTPSGVRYTALSEAALGR